MTTPKYTITNLILNYIVKYELAIKKIKDTPMPKPFFETFKEKYQAEEIDKLGELIAYPIGYSKALTVQRGQVLPSHRGKQKIFTNFKNAQDYVDRYDKKSALKPSIELSAHLNRVLMKNIVDEWDLGREKKFSEKPFDMYDTWYKLRDYYPSINNSEYFNDIFQWIMNDSTGMHKLIQISILLFEFIDKAPFYAGNQITTILTVEALTKEYGYNPYNLIPLSKAIYNISEDLESAFKMSKSKKDLTIFIEAFLYTISLSAIEVSKDMTETFEGKVKTQKKLGKDLNSRQVKIIDYLNTNAKVTRQEYTKMMGVSFMTSYRDLQELLEKEYIVQQGVGRGTYYVIPDEPEGSVTEVEQESNEDIKVFK